MIRLADELEQQVKGWRARYFGLSHEFGEIINKQQAKLSVYSKKTNV